MIKIQDNIYKENKQFFSQIFLSHSKLIKMMLIDKPFCLKILKYWITVALHCKNQTVEDFFPKTNIHQCKVFV